MASSLNKLQSDLLREFFAREKRFFLTGGGALAGDYFGYPGARKLSLARR